MQVIFVAMNVNLYASETYMVISAPGSCWKEDVVDGCHKVVDGGGDGGSGSARGVADIATRCHRV